MECPYCRKYIDTRSTHCAYCGGKTERNAVQRISEVLGFGRTREESFLKALADGKSLNISSIRGLELYIRHKLQDEETAIVIIEAVKRSGDEGFVEVRRGGDGEPYRVETIRNASTPNMSRREMRGRIEQLCEATNARNLTSDEVEKMRTELFRLVPYHAIIWVNASSQKEFNVKQELVMKGLKIVEEWVFYGLHLLPFRTEA